MSIRLRPVFFCILAVILAISCHATLVAADTSIQVPGVRDGLYMYIKKNLSAAKVMFAVRDGHFIDVYGMSKDSTGKIMAEFISKKDFCLISPDGKDMSWCDFEVGIEYFDCGTTPSVYYALPHPVCGASRITDHPRTPILLSLFSDSMLLAPCFLYGHTSNEFVFETMQSDTNSSKLFKKYTDSLHPIVSQDALGDMRKFIFDESWLSMNLAVARVIQGAEHAEYIFPGDIILFEEGGVRNNASGIFYLTQDGLQLIDVWLDVSPAFGIVSLIDIDGDNSDELIIIKQSGLDGHPDESSFSISLLKKADGRWRLIFTTSRFCQEHLF